MSLLHTESFIAFGRTAGDDTFTAPNVAERTAMAANLTRAGYDVIIGTQVTSGTSNGFAIRADPTVSERNTLAVSCAISGSAAIGIRKQIPASTYPIVMGFSIFVPSTFVLGTTASAIRVMATSKTAAFATAAAVASASAANEVFRLRADLLTTWSTNAPLSTKAIVPGRLAYMECRITDEEIKVWLDDVLVFQKNSQPLMADALAICFDPAGQQAGTAGRIAISNWYILSEDTVAPAVRLGPSTRVIGMRANADVSVQFTRPGDVGSNAAVAGQDLVDAPPRSLQSSVVGDTDIYSTASDTSTAAATLVHAVVTKSLTANLEGSAHSFKPFVKSAGVEGADPRARQFELVTAISARNYKSVALRPSDGAMFMVGAGYSVLRTPANGDGSTWSTLTDDLSANINYGVAFRASDSVGVIVRGDGKISVIDASTDALTLVTPTGSATALFAIVVSNNGTFIAFGSAGKIYWTTTPLVAASWTLVTIGAADFMDATVNRTTGRVMGMVTAQTVVTSDNNGAAFTSRATGLSALAGAGACTWDGTNFYIGRQFALTAGTVSEIYWSVDGVTWAQVTGIHNNTNMSALMTINAMAANTTTGEMVAGCTIGGIGSTKVGLAWRLQSRLNTTATLFGAALTSTGGFVLCGDSGLILISHKPPVEWPLTPLAGYLPTFNASNVDPSTGAAWTGASAAVAQIGVRLTA